LADKGKIDSYSKDSLTIRKNLKTYKYTRLKELPISCRELANNPNDPVYNFKCYGILLMNNIVTLKREK